MFLKVCALGFFVFCFVFKGKFEKYICNNFILLFCRLEEQKNIVSEFQRDLNEFIFWLEEVDNITTIGPEPGNEQQLKEKLEQVKVILFSKAFQAYLY